MQTVLMLSYGIITGVQEISSVGYAQKHTLSVFIESRIRDSTTVPMPMANTKTSCAPAAAQAALPTPQFLIRSASYMTPLTPLHNRIKSENRRSYPGKYSGVSLLVLVSRSELRVDRLYGSQRLICFH